MTRIKPLGGALVYISIKYKSVLLIFLLVNIHGKIHGWSWSGRSSRTPKFSNKFSQSFEFWNFFVDWLTQKAIIELRWPPFTTVADVYIVFDTLDNTKNVSFFIVKNFRVCEFFSKNFIWKKIHNLLNDMQFRAKNGKHSSFFDNFSFLKIF